MTAPQTVPREDPRRRDPEGTKEDILRVATAEFATEGFAGARVDQIAAETATTKRMIYYYFGSKEGLYLHVIEAAYDKVRSLEQDIDVGGMTPVAALRQLAEFTFDHHTSHEDFIRLVQIENIHRAEHISHSSRIRELNTTAIDTLRSIIARGVQEGVFRTDIDPLDAHMMISSYSIFAVANRHTFNAVFGRDMLDPSKHEFYRSLAGDMIVATLTRGAS